MTSLPNVTEQALRLIALGVPGISESALTTLRDCPVEDALLVVHPDLAPASTLAPLVRVSGKAGFVVTDMVDVDDFESVVPLPDSDLYLVGGLLHEDRLPQAHDGGRARRPHPGDLVEQRHRSGRACAPGRPEGRLVLGR